MIKLLVAFEFYFLKVWYFMVAWNWFIDENLYDYNMDFTTSMILVLILNAIQLKMTVNTSDWEHEPWMYLVFQPIAFGLIFLTSWIIKLIII